MNISKVKTAIKVADVIKRNDTSKNKIKMSWCTNVNKEVLKDDSGRVYIITSNKEIKNRLDKLPKFKQNIKSSYLRRYSKLVTSANTGAILKSN